MKVIMKSRMRESRTYGSAKEFTSRGVDLLNWRIRKMRKGKKAVFRRLASGMIAAALAAGITGCGSSGSGQSQKQNQEETIASVEEFTGEPVEAVYPLSEKKSS